MAVRVWGGATGPVLLGLAACFVLSCAGPGANRRPSDAAAGERVDIDVTLDADARVLRVRLDLPGSVGPVAQLPFHRGPFGRDGVGYEAFVRTLDGRPVPDEVEVPPTGLRMEFIVELRHADAEPAAGIDEVPHPTAGGWFLVGRAFLPVVRRANVTISVPGRLALHLPEGWELLSSAGYGARVSDSTTFDGGLAELRDAFYYTGHFHHRRVTRSGAVVELATADWPESSLDTLEVAVRGVQEFGTRALGPLSASRRLVIYDRLPQGFAGGVVGRGIAVLASTPPPTRLSSPAGSVLVHELTHQWLVADAWWLGEGLTTYMATLAAAHLDGVSEQAMADATLALAREYLANAGELSVGELTDDRAYSAGATVAFCLDVALHAESHSVPEMLTRARTLTPDGAWMKADTFREVVAAASPVVDTLLEGWLSTRQPIDVAACYRRAGHEVAEVAYSGYTMRAIALDILKAPSFSTQRAEIFRTLDGSPFQSGDLLESVDGHAIDRVDDLDWLLRDVPAGAPVRIQVLRAGSRAEVPFTMPAVAAEQRPARVRTTVTVASGGGLWRRKAPGSSRHGEAR